MRDSPSARVPATEITDQFRKLVSGLPTILNEDPERSRQPVRRTVGDAIQVEADEREVRFYAEKQASKVSLLRAAGAGNGVHREMVAEAGLALA